MRRLNRALVESHLIMYNSVYFFDLAFKWLGLKQ